MAQRAAFDEVPVDVKAQGYAGVYRAEQAGEIEKGFRRALKQHLWQSELRVRSHDIELEGTHAQVNMRLMSQRGPFRVETELEKIASGWKVSKVYVERGL